MATLDVDTISLSMQHMLASPEHFSDTPSPSVSGCVGTQQTCPATMPVRGCSGQISDLSTTSSNPSPCSAPCAIVQLPARLLIRIFSYFPPKQLVCQLSPVCRYFYSLSYASELWHTLDIRVTSYAQMSSVRSLLETIGASVERFTIHVTGNVRSFECVQMGIPKMPRVRALNVGFNQIDQANLAWLIDSCPNVNDLNIEGCDKVTDKYMYDISIGWPSLQHINISHCVHITDEGVGTLTNKLQQIVNINLDGINNVTDELVWNFCYDQKFQP